MSDFQKLVEPYRASLRLHCYRMLGSSHDGDDMVQETFLRAFRSRHTLETAAAVRGWLYRIATNVCLDELQKRPRRARGPELGEPGDPELPPAKATPDELWLEPCPSAWLDTVDPASAYTLKESVALAFIALLQALTPAQRAVLLLRDVVGLSAEETARTLETSVSAANSALHRARAALERVGARASVVREAAGPVDRALLERYLRAWESGDLDTIVGLLHEEVTLSMPPIPTWLSGRQAIGRFFQLRVRPTAEAHLFRTVPIEANGGSGAGFYRIRENGSADFFALQVLGFREGRIAIIDHFMSKSAHAAFFALSLAPTIRL